MLRSRGDTIKKHNAQALIGFSYLFGLVCASFLEGRLSFACSAVLAAIFALLKLFNRCSFRIHFLSAAVAMLVFGCYSSLVIEPIKSLSGTTAEVNGTVIESTFPSNDTVYLTVSGNVGDIPVKFSFFVPDTNISAGDKVVFSAEFSEPNVSAEFSEADYNFSKGIFTRATAKSEITVLSHSFSFKAFLADISNAIKSKVKRVLPSEESSVLCAVFFGDKSGLSDLQSASLRRAGLSHIAAVSGMHLSLIVHTLRLLLFDRIKGKRALKSLLTMAMILLLMMFFGMGASVMRAGIMLIIYYGGELLFRKTNPLNSIGAALLIILIFQPYACRDVGLWLSVLGTIGVGVVAPSLCERLIHSERFRSVKESIISSLCALFCTFPISMLCFGGVSIVSPISTLLIYPPFMGAVILMLMNLFTGGLFTELFMLPAGFCARAMNMVFYSLGGLPFSYVFTDGAFWQMFSFVTALGMLSMLIFKDKLKYFIRFSAVSMCVIIGLTIYGEYSRGGRIEITLYSDGSDGMAVIKSNSGISFISTGDSERITSEMLSLGIGDNILFVCAANSTNNNIPALKQLDAQVLHTPDTPDSIYFIGNEYRAIISEGQIYIYIDEITISLTDIDNASTADFAVYSGYRKKHEVGRNYAEIFFDKRMKTGHNAYYNKVTIELDSMGHVLFSTGGLL